MENARQSKLIPLTVSQRNGKFHVIAHCKIDRDRAGLQEPEWEVVRFPKNRIRNRLRNSSQLRHNKQRNEKKK